MNWKESLAWDIYNWCKEHDLWQDITIYFDGKAWSSDSGEWGCGNHSEQLPLFMREDLYLYENKNPLDYFEYANPDTVSMSFEGELYYVLNGYTPGWVKLEAEFLALFEKYGFYYELGNAWNLAAFQLP